MLSLIGLGICNDLTEHARKVIKKASSVYVEYYTNWLPPDEELNRIIGKGFIKADREMIEQKGDEIIAKAKEEDIVILFPGDPLSATTHIDLLLRAKKVGVKTEVIHNSSIFTAIAKTGLQLYKFGKTASIPFPSPGFRPESPFKTFLENQSVKAHTLFLLDILPEEDKFMTPNEAISLLLEAEKSLNSTILTKDTLCVGCSRLGMDGEEIIAGTMEGVAKYVFKQPPYCLIIPSDMHFTEEEMLDAHRR
ncbi:MAG: diphthine synthase [Nanoarchaeota archaeon]